MNQEPIINGLYLLEKFDTKGGWTFARIPEIPQNKNTWFGWVKVSGMIDDYEFKNHTLMPMGNGTLFFSVKAEIRKKIKKEAGDYVHLILYTDKSVHDVERDLLDCLQDEPKALSFYQKLGSSDQKAFIDWIGTSKSEQIKEERLAKSIDLLLVNEKLRLNKIKN